MERLLLSMWHLIHFYFWGMCRIVIFIAAILLFQLNGHAQKRRGKPASFQRHYNEIFPALPQYRLGGWYIAPGATYMLTWFKSEEAVFESATQSLNASIKPMGKPGIYFEVGRYRMLPYSRLFKYLDYGIAYKSLRGKESLGGDVTTVPAETVIGPVAANSSFGYHYATAHFNLNHVTRLGKYNFLQNTIGANTDYAFIANFDAAYPSLASPADPGKILAQLHYKIGYGIKMRGNLMLIPALETPILNFMPFDLPRSSLHFFSSRYRPIIFSLRFLFIRPAKGDVCTPVKTREGTFIPSDMDQEKQKMLDQMNGQ